MSVDVFCELPLKKREYMEKLFANCTQEVREHMNIITVNADQTLIKVGEKCDSIYIILSGKVVGVEWPMNERAYFFMDFGAGDFFGEIEFFSDLENYRISIVTLTECRVLVIPILYYMRWMQRDADALYLRTKYNMKRLITQTADARKYLFLDGRERLIMYLVRKYEQKQPIKKIVEIKQTRTQISEEVGFCTKTLNRNIKKLEEQNWIQVQKGKIFVSQEGYRQMKEYIEYYING